MLMVYSATHKKLEDAGLDPAPTSSARRCSSLLGVGVMVLVASIDYRVFRDFAPVLYVGGVTLLLFVLSPLGSTVRGTQAWFQLGPFQLQPSEFAKLVVIVCWLAVLRALHRGELDGAPCRRAHRPSSAVPMAHHLPPARPRHRARVRRHPDGRCCSSPAPGPATSSCVDPARRRRRRRRVPARRAEAVPARPPRRLPRSRPTTSSSRPTTSTSRRSPSARAASRARACSRAARPTSPTCPSSTPTSSSRWWARSSASLGSALLLALFAIMVWRTWRAAALAKDLFGTLVCVGVLAMLVFQIFENVGMTMGIMPITGIPLPFVSLRRLVDPRLLRRHRPRPQRPHAPLH